MTDVALAVDLGGTKIEAALVDPAGVLLPGSRFRAPTGGESSSEQLAASATSVVTQALATLPADAALVGVGIGSAGPITVDRGLVSPLNLPSWRDFPLRDHVAALVPVARWSGLQARHHAGQSDRTDVAQREPRDRGPSMTRRR